MYSPIKIEPILKYKYFWGIFCVILATCHFILKNRYYTTKKY